MNELMTMPAVRAAQPSAPSARDSLAIVGMDCLFPDAPTIARFWENVLTNHCSLRLLHDSSVTPSMRDQVEPLQGAPMPTLDLRAQQFRLLPNTIQKFDPRVLPMLRVIGNVLEGAPHVARESTLLILCSQKALPPAGAATYLQRRLEALALFQELLAAEDFDVQTRQRLQSAYTLAYDARFPDPGFEGFLGESSSLMASLASKVFHLGGGLIALDATCASAIPALQLAWNSLYSGHCDAALVVAMSPEVLPARAKYLTSTIFTRDAVLPFDTYASGSAPGEGIGAVLVKRLGDAEAHGDAIQAVVRGIGFSSDDAGSGFVSPQKEGQVRAMRQAYRQARIEPEQVRLIEGHGTGTQKGDLTELHSLGVVFGDRALPPESRVLGSVKGNVGHMLEAAGMAGLMKACGALRSGLLPPTIFGRHARSCARGCRSLAC